MGLALSARPCGLGRFAAALLRSCQSALLGFEPRRPAGPCGARLRLCSAKIVLVFVGSPLCLRSRPSLRLRGSKFPFVSARSLSLVARPPRALCFALAASARLPSARCSLAFGRAASVARALTRVLVRFAPCGPCSAPGSSLPYPPLCPRGSVWGLLLAVGMLFCAASPRRVICSSVGGHVCHGVVASWCRVFG